MNSWCCSCRRTELFTGTTSPPRIISVEVVLRPTFQTSATAASVRSEYGTRGTDVLDVRVWGVGGVLFVVTFIKLAREVLGESCVYN